MKAGASGCLAAASLLAMAACAPPPRADLRPTDQAPLGHRPDASFDWHRLVIMPFGTLLKESPVALHEVLLFHDESRGATQAERKDCFGVDAEPPSFAGERPEVYLLCFNHDHLSRIDAAVELPAATAERDFARACALWLKNSAALPSGNTCEGRDGDIAFSAHLESATGESILPLRLTLLDAAERDAMRDAASAAARDK